jgi:hypothetical protein
MLQVVRGKIGANISASASISKPGYQGLLRKKAGAVLTKKGQFAS